MVLFPDVYSIVKDVSVLCITLFENHNMQKENKEAALRLAVLMRRIETTLDAMRESTADGDHTGILQNIDDLVSHVLSCLKNVESEMNRMRGVLGIVKAKEMNDELEKAMQYAILCDARLENFRMHNTMLERMNTLFAKIAELATNGSVDKTVDDAIKTFSTAVQSLLPQRSGASSSSDSVGNINEAEERNLIAISLVPAAMRELVISAARPGLHSSELMSLIKQIIETWDFWHIDEQYLEYEKKKIAGRKEKYVKLGSGGFGDVYAGTLEVRDGPNNGQRCKVAVAIKEIRISTTKELLVSEVIREALLQFTLRHPCILLCHGVSLPHFAGSSIVLARSHDEDDNETSIVTERMSCNLAEALFGDKKKSLCFADKVKIMTDIALALTFLHLHRVVHRDVKPENILLNFDDDDNFVGNAKLSDFGCSRRANIEQTTKIMTTVGTRAMGTPLFMPPEVLLDVEDCKTTSGWDIWSFGVTLCYIFAQGSRPDCNPMDARQMVRDGSWAAKMKKWASDIQAENIRLIAESCLQDQPGNRANALADFTFELWKESVSRRNDHAQPEEQTETVPSYCSPSTESRASRELENAMSGYGDDTVRVWDVRTSNQVGATLTGHTSRVWGVAMSADGTKVVSGSADETVRVWDVKTSKQVGAFLTGHTEWLWGVAISADGTKVVSGSGNETIRVWDVSTSKQVGATLTGHTGWVRGVAMSADGTKVVSGSADETVRVWDVRTSKQVGATLTGHTDWVMGVAMSVEGTKVVSGSADKTVRVWDVKTSKQVGAFLTGHTGYVRGVAMSADGRTVVSGSGDKTVRVWDVRTSKQVGATLTGHTGWVRGVAMSADGRTVVSGSGDMTVRVWDVRISNQVGATLTGHTGLVNGVAMSVDGTRVVSGSADETVRVWKL